MDNPNIPNTNWRDNVDCMCSRLKYFLDCNEDKVADVIFAVGEEKEKIKGVKLILSASSPVFERMFSDEWDQERQQEPILVPDVTPTIFKKFLTLLSSHNVNSKSLKDDGNSVEDIFQLLYLAQKYIVTHLMKLCLRFLVEEKTIGNVLLIHDHLQFLNEPEVTSELFQFVITNIRQIVQKTSGFSRMSKRTLDKILACDELNIPEVELFQATYKWAEFQCIQAEEKLEKTSENIRNILGSSLNLIRFPSMTPHDFAAHVLSTKLIPDSQSCQIFALISLTEAEWTLLDLTNFPFCTRKRRQPVRQLKDMGTTYLFPVDEGGPQFICNGTNRFGIGIQPNRKIEIYSVSFHGRISTDSEYSFTITDKSSNITIATKTVFAKKGEILHFEFDSPIILEATYREFWIYIKGANRSSSCYTVGGKTEDGITFYYNPKLTFAEMTKALRDRKSNRV